jgi:hypothetical protein
VLARASAPSSSSSSGQPLPPPARLVVHAPIVVASCGAVHTPALLLRSGIRGGFQVGANLRVHPATGVVAVFPQTDAQRAAGAGAVNMYEGVSMAVYSTAASHREGAGYGALLSVPACQPGLLAALTPDAGGPGSMKRLLLQLPNCSLVRAQAGRTHARGARAGAQTCMQEPPFSGTVCECVCVCVCATCACLAPLHRWWCSRATAAAVA